MAGTKKPAKIASAKAESGSKAVPVIVLSKRACTGCGNRIPVREVKMIEVISFSAVTHKQSTKREYYDTACLGKRN